jgi:hypothetical protein
MFEPKSGKPFKWQGIKFHPAGKNRWENYNIFTQKTISLIKLHTIHYETYEIRANGMIWWHNQYEIALGWAFNKTVSIHTIEKYYPKLIGHNWNLKNTSIVRCNNCDYHLNLDAHPKSILSQLRTCKEQQIKNIID